MKTWKTIAAAVALFAIGAFAYAPLGSTQEGKSIEQMIAGAKTPADHEAIAAHYDKEAKDAHEKHTKHQKMEEFYQKNPAMNKAGFSFHCDRIALDFQEAARNYENLAKLHREMAKPAK